MISHLILISSFVSSPLPKVMGGTLGLFGSGLPPLALVRMAMLGWRPPAQAAAAFDAMFRRLDPALMRDRARVALGVDASAALATTVMPLLVISGHHDHLCGTRLNPALRKCRPDAEFITLDGPHCLMETQPAMIAGCVSNWFGKK